MHFLSKITILFKYCIIIVFIWGREGWDFKGNKCEIMKRNIEKSSSDKNINSPTFYLFIHHCMIYSFYDYSYFKVNAIIELFWRNISISIAILHFTRIFSLLSFVLYCSFIFSVILVLPNTQNTYPVFFFLISSFQIFFFFFFSLNSRPFLLYLTAKY